MFCVMTSRERKHILENALNKTPNNAYEHQRKRKALNWLNTSNYIEKKMSWIWKKEIALTTTHKSLVHITNVGYNTDV